MICCGCQTHMTRTTASGAPMYTCLKCHSVWVNGRTFKRLLKEEYRTKLRDVWSAIESEGESNLESRICPDCTKSLFKLRSLEVELDICKKCSGVFFDEHEIRAAFPKSLESGVGHVGPLLVFEVVIQVLFYFIE